MSNENPVPRDEFNADVAEWTDRVGVTGTTEFEDVALARHFDIPMSDIQSMLDESKDQGAENVRAYVGASVYDEDQPNKLEMRLFLVGLDSDNQPIWTSPAGSSAIYDLITPCPPTCNE